MATWYLSFFVTFFHQTESGVQWYSQCRYVYQSGCFIETRHLGAAKRARTIRAQQKGRRTKRAQGKRAQNKKGAEQKARRAKRAQNKEGARSRCCVTVTFKVVISSDNRVLSQSFFFFCRNIIHSLRLHCLKYVSIKSLKTEESYNSFAY